MGVVVRQKVKGRGEPWWVFVAHDGQRTSKQVGAKDAAKEVAKLLEARLALGEDVFAEKRKTPTFMEYSKSFMDGYSKMNHKDSTSESYQSALDIHLLPVFGEMTLDTITRKYVKGFIAQKSKEGLSAGTIRNLKAYLSCILTQAMDDELIPANPASMTGKLIKKTDGGKEINPFTWEEKAVLEEAMQEHFPRHYPFFLTALRTGLRLGELLALQPGDLDFQNGFIEVRRAFSKGRLSDPKNGKIRRVDMSDQLATCLTSHLTERKKETLQKGWKELPEWLFYNETGGLVDGDNIRKRVFYKCLEKAGLRQIRIHDLRHTYATMRIMKGDNIYDVSKQLGHHSVKLTLDTYTHWIPGSKKSEVNELDFNTAPTCTPSAPDDAIEQKKELAE